MSTSTVHLHRVLRAKPEKIYKAFLDAEAMVKWLPPHGFTGKVDHVDARVGGTYRMSFTNFSNGQSHAFGGEYLELTPHERIRYADQFEGRFVRHGVADRAGRSPRRYPGGGLLFGLAGVAEPVGVAGGGRDSGRAVAQSSRSTSGLTISRQRASKRAAISG